MEKTMNLFQWLFPFGSESAEEGRFTHLRAGAILKTAEKLEQRISERFPIGIAGRVHGVPAIGYPL